ncbi:hypothetical protein PGT21_036229 [Puccinia graminis f. sp. tritici]|uniref:Uncharacterized protein n=1 Tax=Puccinia graminis f. sp. tritici TaxID=56615 RepID=A0A5B0QD59_PUCGR|nr:hypothetical protein PGT21_036229 [Puccinia graminis f. sp. tritici]
MDGSDAEAGADPKKKRKKLGAALIAERMVFKQPNQKSLDNEDKPKKANQKHCSDAPKDNVDTVEQTSSSNDISDIAYPYARTEDESKFSPCDSRLKIFIAPGTTIVATC